jgi:hypothetical protein
MVATRNRNRLQTAVRAERTQDVSHVVSDRLDAQMELTRDSFGGTSPCQQTENFGLPRGEARVRRIVIELFFDVGDLAEDSDTAISAHQSDGADLDVDAVAVGVEDDDVRIRVRRTADDVAGEVLARPTRLLGSDDRSELATADIADQSPRRGVQPADDSRRIQDVRRHVHRLERCLDVAADPMKIRQRCESVGRCGDAGRVVRVAK